MPRLLIIEDYKSLAVTLKRALEREVYDGVEEYSVEIETDPDRALELAKSGDFEVIITDLHLHGKTDFDTRYGFRIIQEIRAAKPQLPIILMTGDEATEHAIEAIKLGAFEYILKTGNEPLIASLLDSISKAVATRRLVSETVEYGASASSKQAIIGTSHAMQLVYKDIGRLAATPVTVLIQGETGTGKELVARALHQHGDRKDQAFIAVNCVAIPETLLESELFGHEKGAYTGADIRRIGRFEQANHGTIFLDEIGDMTMGTQAKLLRVLQDRTIQRLGGREPIPVDIRIITATHRDLEQAIQEHAFREDLYYRLNVASIHLPPLRDRKEDIPALVNHFAQRFTSEPGFQACAIGPDVLEYLQLQEWHGNVRELENVVCKALLRARGQPITMEIVSSSLGKTVQPSATPDQTPAGYVAGFLERAMESKMENIESALMWDVEYELYKQVIDLTHGNQAKAAEWLGVSRPTMHAKLKIYGLLPSSESGAARKPAG